MLLLLTWAADPVAADAEKMLRSRGVAFARLHAAEIFTEIRMTQRFGARGSVDRRFEVDGQLIDLREVSSVWHRRWIVPTPTEVADPRMQAFARLETDDVLLQTWSELDVRFLPGSLAVIRAGQRKLRQLRLATALGLEVPPSLLTTDRTALLDFHREHDGQVITKLVSTSAMNQSGLTHELIRYTEALTTRQLAASRSVQLCPVFAQARVPKALELRITVVGSRVFAAEIHSQRSRHALVDFRRVGPHELLYRPHELPATVAEQCVALVDALDLHYGAIDMILRPDGRYVFLEINPVGEFHWIERRTGLPITAAIVDFLAEKP